MNANCKNYSEWIERSIFEEITDRQKADLETHLANCPDCASERELLLSTFSELRAFPEVASPRHFYIAGPSRVGVWDMFQQMSLFWRMATASFLLGILLIGGAAAANLRVQSQDGQLTLAFGELHREPKIDPEQLKASLRREIELEMDQRQALLIQQVRQEIAALGDTFSTRQRQLMAVALNKLEDRMGERIDQQTLETRARFQDAAAQIYKTLSREQKRQVALLNDRLDLLNVRDQIQGDQTQALMATVLQIADLNGGSR